MKDKPESVIVHFGDRDWTASLNLQQAMALRPILCRIPLLRNGKPYANVEPDEFRTVVAVALRRHHPEIDRMDIFEIIELERFKVTIDQIYELAYKVLNPELKESPDV